MSCLFGSLFARIVISIDSACEKKPQSLAKIMVEGIGAFRKFNLSSLYIPPGCHVKQDPLPCLINAEGLPLFIDMFNHHAGHFIGVGSESPFSKPQSLQAFEQELVEFGLLDNG